MKFTITGMALIAFLIFPGGSKATAQPYRRLTVDDFQGVPQPNTGAIAYTNCEIDFRYTAHRESDYYRLNFDIKLSVDITKSWMDKAHITSPEMFNEILKHEQGHYTIAYMEQQEVLREVNKTRFGADYQQKAAEIFNRIDAKYKQLNLDYDEDTVHMTNRVQQHSWDVYFYRKLQFMPPVSNNLLAK